MWVASCCNEFTDGLTRQKSRKLQHPLSSVPSSPGHRRRPTLGAKLTLSDATRIKRGQVCFSLRFSQSQCYKGSDKNATSTYSPGKSRRIANPPPLRSMWMVSYSAFACLAITLSLPQTQHIALRPLLKIPQIVHFLPFSLATLCFSSTTKEGDFRGHSRLSQFNLN